MAYGITLLDNVNPPTPEYPHGNVRDNTGGNNGTPANTKTLGDFHQFFARLMNRAGITPNGFPDNAYTGFQLFEAFESYVGGREIGLEGGTKDLDNYKDPGVYPISVLTPTNAPFPIGNAVGESEALLFVTDWSSTVGMQVVCKTNGTGFARRVWTKSTGVFSAWSGVNKKSISIPAWNMDTDVSLSVPHLIADGMDKIIKIDALIRDDNSSGLLDNYKLLSHYTNQAVQGGVDWDNSDVLLERLTGGVFDSALYNNTGSFGIHGSNRGTLRIEYSL
jgi:hypothetical protein